MSQTFLKWLMDFLDLTCNHVTNWSSNDQYIWIIMWNRYTKVIWIRNIFKPQWIKLKIIGGSKRNNEYLYIWNNKKNWSNHSEVTQKKLGGKTTTPPQNLCFWNEIEIIQTTIHHPTGRKFFSIAKCKNNSSRNAYKLALYIC